MPAQVAVPVEVAELAKEEAAMPGCPLDGMCLERGLPETLSDEAVATIVATTATVAPNLLDITKGFYGEVRSSWVPT